SHLMNRPLFRPFEHGPGNLVAVTDPLDDRGSEGFAQGADLPFLIEAIGNLPVGQASGEMPHALHNRGGIPHAVSYIERKLHANVTAGRPATGCEPEAAWEAVASRP